MHKIMISISCIQLYKRKIFKICKGIMHPKNYKWIFFMQKKVMEKWWNHNYYLCRSHCSATPTRPITKYLQQQNRWWVVVKFPQYQLFIFYICTCFCWKSIFNWNQCMKFLSFLWGIFSILVTFSNWFRYFSNRYRYYDNKWVKKVTYFLLIYFGSRLLIFFRYY